MINHIKIIYWNCWGVSNSRTIDHIKDVMRHFKATIIFLVETKEDTDHSLRFYKRFA